MNAIALGLFLSASAVLISMWLLVLAGMKRRFALLCSLPAPFLVVAISTTLFSLLGLRHWAATWATIALGFVAVWAIGKLLATRFRALAA